MKRHIGFLIIFPFVASSLWGQSFETSWERDVALHQLMDVSAGSAVKQSGGNDSFHPSKVAILFSAVIPGTGQLYARSWLKGILFLAAEAALWTGNAKFNDEGEAWENDFHDYAHAHWSEEVWQASYNPETDPSSHHLPETETQQYFEMIGKYDQFKQGWDDWNPAGPDLTPNRDTYETMRDNSNKAFKKASYCSMAILGNHLISALDAAFTVRKMNIRIASGMQVTPWVNEPVMMTGVAMQW